MRPEFVTDCDSYIREVTSIRIDSVTEADIFGPTSRMVGSFSDVAPQVVERLSALNNYGFQIVILLLFILYCYMGYNFRNSIILLFKLLPIRVSTDNKYHDQPLLFKQFTNICLLLGLLLISGFAIKLMDVTKIWGLLAEQIPELWLNFTPLAVMGIVLILRLYKHVSMWIIANVTQTEELLEEQKSVDRAISSTCYVILTPLFLLCAANSGSIVKVVIITSIVICAIIICLYLIKSYRLFMERNIFIVQWILYLCAVDLFPLSLLLFLVLRNI